MRAPSPARSIALGALAVSLLFAGCAPAGPVPGHRTRLTIAQLREPSSLNPLLIDGSVAENLGALAFSYLVAVDERGRVVPDVATEVPTLANGGISRDGRTVTYRLRRGVRWHDGEPLTARDVLFTYRAVMNPRNNVPTRLGFDQIAAIAARDPYTIRVTLKHPFAPFVTYFLEPENFPILPAHVLERLGDLNGAAYNRLPIGSGPYRVVEWVRGDHVLLAANPNYWRGRPAIDSIVVRFVASEETILTGLRSHEIDGSFDLSPAMQPLVQHLAHATARPYLVYGFGALIFNTRASIVDDARVRRAVVAAIDRDGMVRKVSHGALHAGGAAQGLFGWAYAPEYREPRYDPQAADALLAAAGWSPSAEGPRWRRARRLELDLAYENSSAIARSAAVVIQQQAARSGIDIRLKGFAPIVFHALAGAGGPLNGGRFALALDTVLTGYDPETSWFLRCDQAPPNGSNYSRYCDATADAAQVDALGTFDETRRAADYRTVQRRVAADVPVAFLWRTAALAVVPSALTGLQPSPETPYWACWRWTLR